MANKRKKTEVALIMGSDSDWPHLEPAMAMLESFGIHPETRVLSAHRTPGRAAAFAARAAGRGLKVIIAAAGGAAHLAGALAARTTLPVIGIPIQGGALDGLDALLATVQMPAGVPVATVALGRAGAANAALLAVQILALSSPDLQNKLARHKKEMMRKVEQSNRDLKQAQEKKS